jgi:hypothetical protein
MWQRAPFPNNAKAATQEMVPWPLPRKESRSKGFGANRKMLIDVLTQQRHCRNVTLRKSYNRAIIETGSAHTLQFA